MESGRAASGGQTGQEDKRGRYSREDCLIVPDVLFHLGCLGFVGLVGFGDAIAQRVVRLLGHGEVARLLGDGGVERNLSDLAT